jgi:hypothetical protein
MSVTTLSPMNTRKREAVSNVDAKRNTKTNGSKYSVFNAWWIVGLGIFVNHLVGIYAILFRSRVSASLYIACISAAALQLLGITVDLC